MKFSINLDVFWRLQPFAVFGSLWEAATAANYLSVRALSCLWDGLVTNVRIVPRCHSFSCSSSVTRPCHYNPFSEEERMRGARERDRATEAERDRPVEWHLSGCPGYCVLGETTPVIAITLAGANTVHIHWAKTAPGRHTHNTICQTSRQHRKILFCWCFQQNSSTLFLSASRMAGFYCVRRSKDRNQSILTIVLTYWMVFKSSRSLSH